MNSSSKKSVLLSKKKASKSILNIQKGQVLFLFNFLLLMGLLIGFSLIVKEKDPIYEPSETEVVTKNQFLGFKKLLDPISYYPVNKDIYPLQNVSAKASIIVDLDSLVTIYEKNADLRLFPASTTKIMTAVIALENYKQDTVLNVGNIKVDGSTINLVAGEKVTVENLLYGLLIASANDTAEVLADNFPGGREAFISAMNNKAIDLNLKNSNFTNPIGYDEEGHFSSARDLATLSIYAIQNPFFDKVVSMTDYSFTDTEGKYLHNIKTTNELIGKIDGIKGIKTGWTENAGGCLVGLVEKNGKKEITVLLGSDDRFGETEKLIAWVFDNFNWEIILPAIH